MGIKIQIVKNVSRSEAVYNPHSGKNGIDCRFFPDPARDSLPFVPSEYIGIFENIHAYLENTLDK